METLNNILETHFMPNGFEIDMDEGFAKLTERQFGGNPGRAFSELIQNAIDSYPNGTSWEERMGEIESGKNWISIKDYGEGMNTERLRLLITLGGTDKFKDPEKIGQFGMGFMAMFNRRLGTREIRVITRCEGHTVQLVFAVKEAGKRPAVSLSVLQETIKYSTCIRAEFSSSASVNDCLEHARNSLTYYPCIMKINGDLFVSQWEHYGKKDSIIFNESDCHGLIRSGSEWDNIAILCKYERIMKTSLDHFITGGHNMHYNLLDFYNKKTPFVPGVVIVLNINKLRVTISRDGYYLDWTYDQALGILNRYLKTFLLRVFDRGVRSDLILANQYIFSQEIASYLSDPERYQNNPCDENRLIMMLANASIFRINGRSGEYSLSTLKRMKRDDFPFYFSPNRSNLRWLGGSFKHDYIVVPDACNLNGGADHFYDTLFNNVFKDVVNLDTIQEDHKKIVDLVQRDIIDKSSLSPNVKIIGPRHLKPREQGLLDEISSLLRDPVIIGAIESNLHLRIRSIRPVFFSLEETGMRISTGLFDEQGQPMNEDFMSNFLVPVEEKDKQERRRIGRVNLLLGLSLDHPFIRYLINSSTAQRNYYALTYLAHELALCQKMLVPYSPFYHLVKEKLALDMRMALIKNILGTIRN